MLGGKLVWLVLVLIVVQGCCCSNSTQKAGEVNATLGTTFLNETHSRKTIGTSATSQNPVFKGNSTNLNRTALEILKIFHGELNTTSRTTTTEQISGNSTLTNFLNVTSVNYEQSRNDTFNSNYTMTAASSDDVQPFRLPNWAAIAAGVCLISAVIGYISCVSYRRFLQRKYGNSQILVGEDVYDTSDLRNFEI